MTGVSWLNFFWLAAFEKRPFDCWLFLISCLFFFSFCFSNTSPPLCYEAIPKLKLGDLFTTTLGKTEKLGDLTRFSPSLATSRRYSLAWVTLLLLLPPTALTNTSSSRTTNTTTRLKAERSSNEYKYIKSTSTEWAESCKLKTQSLYFILTHHHLFTDYYFYTIFIFFYLLIFAATDLVFRYWYFRY